MVWTLPTNQGGQHTAKIFNNGEPLDIREKKIDEKLKVQHQQPKTFTSAQDFFGTMVYELTELSKDVTKRKVPIKDAIFINYRCMFLGIVVFVVGCCCGLIL